MKAGILVACASTAVFLAGCEGNKRVEGRPETFPVRVTITQGGSAVEDATVAFRPRTKKGQGAVGKTDSSGEAEMWTFEPGDGAVPGAYRVTIVKREVPEAINPSTISPGEYERLANGPSEPVRDLLPKRYGDVQATRLAATVKSDDDNEFSFELDDQ